jgi:hypothetical protein
MRAAAGGQTDGRPNHRADHWSDAMAIAKRRPETPAVKNTTPLRRARRLLDDLAELEALAARLVGEAGYLVDALKDGRGRL